MHLKNGTTISIKWEHQLTIKIERAQSTQNEKKTVTSAQIALRANREKSPLLCFHYSKQIV